MSNNIINNAPKELYSDLEFRHSLRKFDPKAFEAIGLGDISKFPDVTFKVITSTADTFYLPITTSSALDKELLGAVAGGGNLIAAQSVGTTSTLGSLGTLSSITTCAGCLSTLGSAGTASSIETG